MIYRFIKWLFAPLVFDLIDIHNHPDIDREQDDLHPIYIRHLKDRRRRMCKLCDADRKLCNECMDHPNGQIVYRGHRNYYITHFKIKSGCIPSHLPHIWG